MYEFHLIFHPFDVGIVGGSENVKYPVGFRSDIGSLLPNPSNFFINSTRMPIETWAYDLVLWLSTFSLGQDPIITLHFQVPNPA